MEFYPKPIHMKMIVDVLAMPYVCQQRADCSALRENLLEKLIVNAQAQIKEIDDAPLAAAVVPIQENDVPQTPTPPPPAPRRVMLINADGNDTENEENAVQELEYQLLTDRPPRSSISRAESHSSLICERQSPALPATFAFGSPSAFRPYSPYITHIPPCNSPVSPNYSPTSPNYSPASPNYSPLNDSQPGRRYSPTSPEDAIGSPVMHSTPILNKSLTPVRRQTRSSARRRLFFNANDSPMSPTPSEQAGSKIETKIYRFSPYPKVHRDDWDDSE